MSHYVPLSVFTLALCVVFALGNITTTSTAHHHSHSNESSSNSTVSSVGNKAFWRLETILIVVLIVLLLITICVMCCMCEAWNRKRSNEWKVVSTQMRHSTWPKGPIQSPKQTFERPIAKSTTKEGLKSQAEMRKDSPRTEPTVTSALTSFKTVFSEVKAPSKPPEHCTKSVREDDSTVTRFATCVSTNDAIKQVPSAAEFEITADEPEVKLVADQELEIHSEQSVKLIPKNDPRSLMSLESETESMRQVANSQVKHHQPPTSLIQSESILAIGSGTLLPNSSDASFRTAKMDSLHSLRPKERVTLRSPSSSNKSGKKSNAGSMPSDF